MIAKRIPTIMPRPTLDEYLEILSIHSASGYSQEFNPKHPKRPFRAPHHTTSDVALLGGGSFPKPEKFHWLTMESSFSMNYPNSNALHLK